METARPGCTYSIASYVDYPWDMLILHLIYTKKWQYLVTSVRTILLYLRAKATVPTTYLQHVRGIGAGSCGSPVIRKNFSGTGFPPHKPCWPAGGLCEFAVKNLLTAPTICSRLNYYKA